MKKIKKAGSLHRTAQPFTLAAFQPWEGSTGAGRVRPAGSKSNDWQIKNNAKLKARAGSR